MLVLALEFSRGLRSTPGGTASMTAPGARGERPAGRSAVAGITGNGAGRPLPQNGRARSAGGGRDGRAQDGLRRMDEGGPAAAVCSRTSSSQCSTGSGRPDRSTSLLRKEVIQPHLPVRLPCYDFTPITDPTFDGSLPKGLGHRLRVLPTFVV